jgi:hypothetical protein
VTSKTRANRSALESIIVRLWFQLGFHHVSKDLNLAKGAGPHLSECFDQIATRGC